MTTATSTAAMHKTVDVSTAVMEGGGSWSGGESSDRRRIKPLPSAKEPSSRQSRLVMSSLTPVYASQLLISGIATPSAVSLVAESGQGLPKHRPEVVPEDDELSQDDAVSHKTADSKRVLPSRRLIEQLPIV